MVKQAQLWIGFIISSSIVISAISAGCGDNDTAPMPEVDAAPMVMPDAQVSVDAAVPADAAEADAPAEQPDAAPALTAELILIELYIDEPGMAPETDDDGYEWIKLYNNSNETLDLAGYSLGWGGNNYTVGTMQLSGMIPSNGCLLVGGPEKSEDNGSPTFGLASNFDPDLENGGDQADGVAVFAVAAAEVEADTIPIDVVIYGAETNRFELIDEKGDVGRIDLAQVDPGEAMRRNGDGSWRLSNVPTPDACTPLLAY